MRLIVQVESETYRERMQRRFDEKKKRKITVMIWGGGVLLLLSHWRSSHFLAYESVSVVPLPL